MTLAILAFSEDAAFSLYEMSSVSIQRELVLLEMFYLENCKAGLYIGQVE